MSESQGLIRTWKAARRLDAAAGINLSQRRAWYDDPPADKPPADGGEPKPPKEEEPPEWVKDPKRAYAEIQKTRSEAAEARAKASAAQKALDAIEAAKQADAEKKLRDQNEFKTLYEQEKAAREQAVADAQAATLTALRLKVATEAGLPGELAARLQGTTEEELKADAEKLKPYAVQKAPGGQKGSTTPVPDGQPAGMTYEQRKARRYGAPSGNPFKG